MASVFGLPIRLVHRLNPISFGPGSLLGAVLIGGLSLLGYRMVRHLSPPAATVIFDPTSVQIAELIPLLPALHRRHRPAPLLPTGLLQSAAAESFAPEGLEFARERLVVSGRVARCPRAVVAPACRVYAGVAPQAPEHRAACRCQPPPTARAIRGAAEPAGGRGDAARPKSRRAKSRSTGSLQTATRARLCC